jgi:hypothetical protein
MTGRGPALGAPGMYTLRCRQFSLPVTMLTTGTICAHDGPAEVADSGVLQGEGGRLPPQGTLRGGRIRDPEEGSDPSLPAVDRVGALDGPSTVRIARGFPAISSAGGETKDGSIRDLRVVPALCAEKGPQALTRMRNPRAPAPSCAVLRIGSHRRPGPVARADLWRAQPKNNPATSL